MNGPFINEDLKRLGFEFAVPIFVVQGTEDDYTPAALSRAYVDWLCASDKEFIPMTAQATLRSFHERTSS